MHAGIDPSRSPPLIALPARASLTSSRLRLLLPPRRLSARDWVGALALAWVVLLALMLAALLFALLGVAIHRWASDPGVGAIFLVFSGSSATALAVIPGALMGSAWAYFLAATAATIAPPALSAVVLWFPRPLR